MHVIVIAINDGMVLLARSSFKVIWQLAPSWSPHLRFWSLYFYLLGSLLIVAIISFNNPQRFRYWIWLPCWLFSNPLCSRLWFATINGLYLPTLHVKRIRSIRRSHQSFITCGWKLVYLFCVFLTASLISWARKRRSETVKQPSVLNHRRFPASIWTTKASNVAWRLQRKSLKLGAWK